MGKFQIWKSQTAYAISTFNKTKLDFFSQPVASGFQKHEVIKTSAASKPSFLDFLKPIITEHGVHPIYNQKGEVCEQIVNIPTTAMTPDDILDYLNMFTILPQGTPPWDEIIYKLSCYSSVLTEEYYIKEKKIKSEGEIANLFLRVEEDTDEHIFVTAPKKFDGGRGRIFSLNNPTRAHRKWSILPEYYDYKENAWITPAVVIDPNRRILKSDTPVIPSPEICIKRKKARIDLADKKRNITQYEINRARKEFLAAGGTIKKLNPEPKKFNWRDLEIHPLAHLIPVMEKGDRDRLKEDIRLNGVNEALWLFEGKILEGRTRFGICLELDIEPKLKPFHGPGSPRAFVLSMNLHRRHLSSSQIAAIGVDQYLPQFEAEAKKRLASRSKNLPGQTVVQAGKGRASILVADFLKTNKKYIIDAKMIKDRSPSIFNQILTGELSISKAKSKLKKEQPKPAKKKPTPKFATTYRLMLEKLVEKSTPQPLTTTDIAFKRLSGIYLNWNKRNGKSLMKKLDGLKKDFPECFQSPQNSHLSIAYSEDRTVKMA